MARIILRNNSTSGKVPTAAQLQVGEVTVNTADGVMHTKHSDGSIKELFPSNVILTRLLNVDGAGSGLDADLLDGQQGSWYAPLASPTFTGTPSAPTAAVGTSTTQLATTAFVQAEIANNAPTKTGTGASGTWNINISGNANSAATVTNGVYTTGDQTIAGVKTFSSSPVVPTATTANQAVNFGQIGVANSAPIKTALNASGNAPIYACRAWVNFDGTGTAGYKTGTYVQSGTTVTATVTNHGYVVGSSAKVDITSGTGVDGTYVVTGVTDANVFTYTAGTSLTTSGNISLQQNTIRASGNVSSITDNAVGDYTVNFTTAMPDGNYLVNGSVNAIVGQQHTTFNEPYTNIVRETTRFRCMSIAGGNGIDTLYTNVSFFR